MNKYQKPTLASAILSPTIGDYYEFKNNGDIIHRYMYFGNLIVNYWTNADQFYPTACRLCHHYDWLLDADFEKSVCSKSECQERHTLCNVCGNDYNNCSRECE